MNKRKRSFIEAQKFGISIVQLSLAFVLVQNMGCDCDSIVDKSPKALKALHSNKCVDVADSSTLDGASIQQWACHGGQNQQWTFNKLDNGTYHLIVQHSKKCLSIAPSDTFDGTEVQQNICENKPTNNWRRMDRGYKQYSLKNVKSGNCLEVSNSSIQNGAIMQLGECKFGGNQVFAISDIQVDEEINNPLITHVYTADPSARVFDGRLYVYASHDIVCEPGFGNKGYCMEDYLIFSTTDLRTWTDHGAVLNQRDIPWVWDDAYTMWAPDCIKKGDNYYFYFPSKTSKDSPMFIGVAVSTTPFGPFEPQPNYIPGTEGFDPNAFVDDDGQAYLFWSDRKIWVAKLKTDMLSLDGDRQEIKGLSTLYKEGPFVFKRNGTYYLLFAQLPGGSEELAYATADSPMGPYTYGKVIMDRWQDDCWTNHGSIVQYKDLWYIFYHHHDLTKNMNLRSIRAERLYFNTDGSIQKVIPKF